MPTAHDIVTAKLRALITAAEHDGERRADAGQDAGWWAGEILDALKESRKADVKTVREALGIMLGDHRDKARALAALTRLAGDG